VELLQRGEKRLIDIGESRPASRLRDMREIGDDYLKELDRRCNQKRAGEVPDGSLSTGWSRLDALTGGLFGDELTIIAARPSKGKTLFACVMARSIAGRGFRVLVCSLEQTDREIYGRLIAAESGVKSHILRGGYVNDDQKERIIDARLRLDEVKILMDDSPAQSVMSIAATARRLLRSGGLNLVIVDYLGLLQPENRREPRHEQVGGMARHLKLLARELNIPVVALAQVGRSAENRTDQRPRLADLKESGGIEEHADCVMFLHKKEREEKEQPPPTEKIEVIVDKCRNGPTGFFFLIHDLAHFTVKEEAWPP
jgi:replicative DNA helicase